MREQLKGIGAGVAGFVVLVAMLMLPLLFIRGGVWVAERTLPFLFAISSILLVLVLFVFAPLSWNKGTRLFSAKAMVFSSFVFGLSLWLWSLLVTLVLWGWPAVIIGLFFAGVGVVPLAVAAAMFSGEWATAGQLILLFCLTFGTRFFAFWMLSNHSREAAGEAVDWGMDKVRT